jgi:hypothetical protein
MAANYIPVSTSGLRLAGSLLSAASQLASTREALVLLKATMDQMVDAGSYLVIEQQFGLPGGMGQATYNLVAGAAAALTASTDVANLTSRFGAVR